MKTHSILTIMRVVHVDDVFPAVVSDSVNDSAMVVWPQTDRVVDQTGRWWFHLKV